MQSGPTVSLPPSQVSPRQDLDRLQGAWVSVAGRHEINLLIAGSHFAVKFKNGPVYMGTLRLDPNQAPRAMDMVITEGPERHQWKTSLCIYEMEGDLLRWCPGEPGRKDRLTDFPSQSQADYYCTVFRRDRG
jgi:uncharacterized protein (TIGR03067 family)